MEKLINDVINLASKASEILKYYHKKTFDISEKKDQSPLTVADIKTHLFLIEGLNQLTPDTPVLSEESGPMPTYEIRKKWQKYWLIDPLDGTKSFIKGKDDFVISIALIENNQPSLGIIYVPMSDTCYYAFNQGGAFKRYGYENNQADIRLKCNQRQVESLTIALGSSKPLSNHFIEKLNKLKPYRLLRTASAIKFCQVAEGVADVYLRLYPTFEWDTAAGQCILSEAGGKCIDLEKGLILSYNEKKSLINPYFIAGAPWGIGRLKECL